MKKTYRLKITDHNRNINYLTRNENGRVSYFSACETPLALCNLVGKAAAALRFALEDAQDATWAARAVADVLTHQWRNNPDLQPIVAII